MSYKGQAIYIYIYNPIYLYRDIYNGSIIHSGYKVGINHFSAGQHSGSEGSKEVN